MLEVPGDLRWAPAKFENPVNKHDSQVCCLRHPTSEQKQKINYKERCVYFNRWSICVAFLIGKVQFNPILNPMERKHFLYPLPFRNLPLSDPPTPWNFRDSLFYEAKQC